MILLILFLKGVILTNDLLFTAKIRNNLNPPIVIEDANLQTEELNLNVISDALNDFDAENTRNKYSQTPDVSQLSQNKVILKNATVSADKILIKKHLLQISNLIFH